MKNIKIILLTFSLISSLAITSYAKSTEQNIDTLLNVKEEVINKRSRQSFENKYTGLMVYYDNIWNSKQEIERRENIKISLNKFNELYQEFNSKEKVEKNISFANSNFNLLQSILLEYYDFSILFNKYNVLIELIMQNAITEKLEEFNNFMKQYAEFITSIKDSVQNINKFCSDILFQVYSKPSSTTLDIQDIQQNQNTIKNTSKKILKLKSNFQKLFERIKIDMKSQVWSNTFSKFAIEQNNLVHSRTPFTKIEIIPKNFENNILTHNLKNNIPPHYTINLHILASVIKMELLKSAPYLQKLKDNDKYNFNIIFISDLLPDDATKNISSSKNIPFSKKTLSYKKIHKYTNCIFEFYNTLRYFIIFCKQVINPFHRYFYTNDKKKFNSSLILNLPKNNKSFIKILKKYINETNRINEIINISIYDTIPNSDEIKYKNIFQQYFFKRHNVYTVNKLYHHIKKYQNIYDSFAYSENNENNAIDSFNEFFENLDKTYFSTIRDNDDNKITIHLISDQNDSDEELLNTKTKPQPTNINIYDSNKFNFNKKTSKTNTNSQYKQLLQYYHETKDINKSLLLYFYNIWNLPQEIKKRQYIKDRLEVFANVYKNFQNINDVKENISISNFDFNLLQSVLLEYYYFSLSFNKYAILIKLIISNEKDIQNLQEYKNFMDQYSKFMKSINNKFYCIDILSSEVLFRTLTDEKITNNNYTKNENNNILDDNKHKQNEDMLNYTAKEILKLESKFQQIFKAMNIDMNSKLWANNFNKNAINTNNLIDENFKFENIDIIPNPTDDYTINVLQTNNLILPHYKINLQILTAIVKMELLKSLACLKEIKNNHMNVLNVNYIFNYQKIHKYTNMIYRFYLNLRCLMNFSGIIKGNTYSDYCIGEEPTSIIKAFILKKDCEFKRGLKRYIEYQENFHDILYSSAHEYLRNYKQKHIKNISQIYYKNRHDVDSMKSLFHHINKKQSAYDDLVKNINNSITDVLDKFFSDLNPNYFGILQNFINLQVMNLKPFENIYTSNTNQPKKLQNLNITDNDNLIPDSSSSDTLNKNYDNDHPDFNSYYPNPFMNLNKNFKNYYPNPVPIMNFNQNFKNCYPDPAPYHPNFNPYYPNPFMNFNKNYDNYYARPVPVMNFNQNFKNYYPSSIPCHPSFNPYYPNPNMILNKDYPNCYPGFNPYYTNPNMNFNKNYPNYYPGFNPYYHNPNMNLNKDYDRHYFPMRSSEESTFNLNLLNPTLRPKQKSNLNEENIFNISLNEKSGSNIDLNEENIFNLSLNEEEENDSNLNLLNPALHAKQKNKTTHNIKKNYNSNSGNMLKRKTRKNKKK